jgi:hypothetical protein
MTWIASLTRTAFSGNTRDAYQARSLLFGGVSDYLFFAS